MSKYWTGGHTKFKLMYHIVWIPKYRKRILMGRIADRLKELFYQCAEVHDWKIEELNVQPDHVYIMIQLRPSISVSKAIQFFKGGSSKKIREEFPDLEEFLWGDSFWADGYFAETCGKFKESVIREYIRNQ